MKYVLKQLETYFLSIPGQTFKIVDNSSKKSRADISIFLGQFAFQGLKPYIPSIVNELPIVSSGWEISIHSCKYDEKTGYLEIFLDRTSAFNYVIRVADLYYRRCEISNITCIVILIYGQNEFDLKRSEVYAGHFRASLDADSKVIIRGISLTDTNGVHLSSALKEKFILSSYFDKSKNAVDLRRYAEDHKGFDDVTLGFCSLDSKPVRMAVDVLNALEAIKVENCSVYHVAPSGMKLALQKAFLFLELAESPDSNLGLFCHGGISVDKSSCLEELRAVVLERSSQLRGGQSSRVADLLADTQICFDLVAPQQMARPSVSNLIESCSSNRKSGIFVQYSCARLAGLFKSLNDGRYPFFSGSAFPISIDHVDLRLLSSEAEWRLLKASQSCHYAFVEARNNATGSLGKEDVCVLSTHLLCGELIALSKEFSNYYSKVKILTDPQPHLMPLMAARLVLLKCIHKILCRGLTLLGLEVIERM